MGYPEYVKTEQEKKEWETLEADALHLLEKGLDLQQVAYELSDKPLCKHPKYFPFLKQVAELYKRNVSAKKADWTVVKQDVEKGFTYDELKSKYYESFIESGLAPQVFMKHLDSLVKSKPPANTPKTLEARFAWGEILQFAENVTGCGTYSHLKRRVEGLIKKRYSQFTFAADELEIELEKVWKAKIKELLKMRYPDEK